MPFPYGEDRPFPLPGAVLFRSVAGTGGAGPATDLAGARSKRTRRLASPALLAVAAAVAAGCASRVVQPAPEPAVGGRCGDEPGVCLLGTPAPLDGGGEALGWRCLGLHGGAEEKCALPALAPPPQAEVEAAAARPAVARPAVAAGIAAAAPGRETAEAGQGAGIRPEAPSPRARGRIRDLLAAKARRTPAQRKVGSRLLELAAARALRESGESPPSDTGPPAQPAPEEGQAEDGRVLVDIRADVSPAVLARIRELGGAVVTSVPGYRAIRALLPLSSVERLAALDAVRTIRTADEAVTRKDTSEGDVAHRASQARRTHGVDGTGIGIGVLSNGVRTLADRQASGDVPAQVTVLPGQEGGGDEGTAMLEIVHDLAPGAELYFATALGGQAQFAANIEALCEAGADVIVDDVGYFAEVTLQDNVITQGIDAATAGGCFYFSAAGNDGNLNDGTSSVWEGDYAAGSALVVDGETLGIRHDFGGGAEENPVGGGFLGSYSGTIVLQWADPLGASSNDYDLFLVDANGDVFTSSTNTQDGTQDPIESISTGFFAFQDARLVVVRASGASRYLRLQAFDGELDIATAGNTFGHSAAENAFGVGQVDVRDAGGAGGVFDGTESVRTSSSDGPRRVFFEADGTPVTAGNFSSTGGKLLQKPDLAAAACVSTATPGFSTFCGTSAAAPHAAAVAALMLEAAGGPARFNLAQLRKAMAGAALDIEAAGVDRDAGAGIVMAARAVDAVDVAVADRNRAPTVARRQGDRTVAPGSVAVKLDLGTVFADPDSDTLAYETGSSDPDRLVVARNGAQGDADAGLAGSGSGDHARDRPGRAERGRAVHGDGRGRQPGLRRRQRRPHRRRYTGPARRRALRPGRRRSGGRRDVAALLHGLSDGGGRDGVSQRRRLHRLRADRGPGLRHRRQRPRRRGRHLLERRGRLGADRRRRRTLRRGLRGRRPYGGQSVHRPVRRGRRRSVRGSRRARRQLHS